MPHNDKRKPAESKVMIGLEIHFQLKGKKLFCECGTETHGVKREKFSRKLSPTASEMGHYDPAAEYEKMRDRTFSYIPTDNSCLVEADEEPPHAPNMDAVETGLMVSNALGCSKVDSVMFMRKVVVDGSNTSGFQRTGILGLDGEISTTKGKVRISTVCVEEDSARRAETEKGNGRDVVYSLDRLGIPLLEIATEPDILDADHAVEVARKLGHTVASTGKARHEVDSIRQDVNISLGFGRVEIKGIQKLSLIGESISHEMERQRNMKLAMDSFNERGGLLKPVSFTDVSDIFRSTSSKMLKSALRSGNSIFCTILSNASGLLKAEKFRVGKDLSDIAKAFGLGGILHTDELPAFGITGEEVESVRKRMKPGDRDALVLIVTVKEKAGTLAGAIRDRMHKLAGYDFSETRGPVEDGTTKFLRPLPGKERMYPETDVPILMPGAEVLRRVESFVPRSEEETAKELSEKFSISLQDARTISSNFLRDEFTVYAETLDDGKLASRLLLQTIPEMEKKHRRNLDREELKELLSISRQNGWSRASLEKGLEFMASEGIGARKSAERVESLSVSLEELENLVRETVREEGSDIRPGALIAILKRKTDKSFDPKIAIQLLNNNL